MDTHLRSDSCAVNQTTESSAVSSRFTSSGVLDVDDIAADTRWTAD